MPEEIVFAYKIPENGPTQPYIRLAVQENAVAKTGLPAEVSSEVATPNTEAAILARVIESEATAVTPDVAGYLLSISSCRDGSTLMASL